MSNSVLLPPPSAAQAQKKLEEAVAHGSHLFQRGHHSECAALYTRR